MARRSRAVVETVKAKFRVWRIAIYIRLSKEDARCLDESESVTNQRQIIEDHIAGFNDGDEYIIVDEYVDDGISGTTDDERDDFQRMLSDYPMDQLHETIVDFHNTKKRLDDFFAMVKADPVGRAGEIQEDIRFFTDRRESAARFMAMLQKGELPLRVTHNDTKYNNILIDSQTFEAVCVIDLDTVMPGLSVYDFGDAIRFAASTALEDETTLPRYPSIWIILRPSPAASWGPPAAPLRRRRLTTWPKAASTSP